MSGMWFDVAPRISNKTNVIKNKIWFSCSKYDNYSRLKSELIWGMGGGATCLFSEHGNLQFHIERDIYMSSNNYEGNDTASIWIC